ncbi:hypothetical protein L873DRAFT_1822988 [Choiromyces venosus 120613-1]|uniref:Uncharacterized protein n=1 Tax=Choiromyces venosus 120613-1 TaxID=1336337 RepID=A0A3N4IWK3_9PEZI|nr:hypothetical protein L873DRAFT_1822988 [Choiromyces venosus 120613-1]
MIAAENSLLLMRAARMLPATEVAFWFIGEDCLSGSIPRWSGLLTDIPDCTK